MRILNLPMLREFSKLRLRYKLTCLYLLILVPLSILGYEHIVILHEYIEHERHEVRAFLPDNVKATSQHIEQLESDIVQTKIVIGAIFVLLNVIFSLMLATDKTQSEKMQQILQQFTHGDFSQRLESRYFSDLQRVTGQINLLGVRQNRSNMKVSDALREVIVASEEVVKIVQESASGSIEQMQSVSAVAAASEEMNNSMSTAAENAEQTNRMSEESAKLASDGERKVRNMHQEMVSINKTVDAATQAIESLQNRSHEVSQIINVIQSIAEQTNLLALNAAIEAARAGEQGRGFAVVADEVRELAAKTSGSTVEIAELIGKMQSEVNQIVANIESVRTSVNTGVEISSEAEKSLFEINRQAQETSNMIAGISISLTQQKDATTEIASSMHRVAEMAENNKHIVEKTNSAAAFLDQLSKDLRSELGT